MGYRNLAEAIILQSLEDLGDPRYSRESMDFFTGPGFKLCAEIAGLHSTEKTGIERSTSDGRKYVTTAGIC